MADCVLPEEMIVCILLRLPVKSILRFRSVCKPWNKLLSSPEFMQMHSQQFSGDPKSEDFIISGYNNSYHQTFSLFSTKCNGKKSRKLNFGGAYPQIIVGCYKGLLCIYHDSSGEIYLWNPALNLSKYIRLSGIDFGAVKHVSIGFGYDDNVGDFKVVRIVCLQGGDRKVAVELYSAKSDSWQTIEVGFSFELFSYKNNVIVNGNPCWITYVRNDVSMTEGVYERCVLWFDVKKLVFKIIPLTKPILSAYGMSVHRMQYFWSWPLFMDLFMDWKGSLAAIRYHIKNQQVEFIYIWVFDEAEMIWRLKHAFRHIDMKVGNFMTCTDNGKFIGSFIDGELIVFDFKTARVKVIEIDDDIKKLLSNIHGYSESLVYIEGMEAVVVKKEEKTRIKRKRVVIGGCRLAS